MIFEAVVELARLVALGLVLAENASPVDPLEILHRTLVAPGVAYSGEALVTQYNPMHSPIQDAARGWAHDPTQGPEQTTRRLRVAYAPGNRLRRELLDEEGTVERLVVCDGETEWLYDRVRGKAWASIPVDPDGRRRGPEEELELLERNYRMDVYEDRVVMPPLLALRPAWKLTLRSLQEGAVVRELWVDKEHGILLQSKAYGPDGAVATWMRYEALRIPAAVDPKDFRFLAPAGVAVEKSGPEPQYLDLEEARRLSELSTRLPGWIPPGYLYESVDAVPYGGVPILHYRYSDGVEALSLFQMPARLRFSHKGKQARRFRVGRLSGRVFLDASRRVLEWRSGPDRFVLVGALPVHQLRRMAGSIR